MKKRERAPLANDDLGIALPQEGRTELEKRIAEHLPEFTPVQKQIASYLLSHPSDAAFLSATEIAQGAGVSDAAVSRFIRAIEFTSVSDFRATFTEHFHQRLGVAARLERKLKDVHDRTDFLASMVEGEIEYLRKALQSITPEDIEQSARLICQSQRAYLVSHRPYRGIVEMLDFRFSRFRVDSVVLQEHGRYILDKARFLTGEDVLIAATFQRIPRELEILFDLAIERGAKTILLTDLTLIPKKFSPDVILSARRGPPDVASSFTVPMAIANAIVWAVGKQLREQGSAAIREIDELRRLYGYEATTTSLGRNPEGNTNK